MTAWIWLAILAALAGSVMTLAVRRLPPRQAGAVAVGGAAVGLAALRQFALAIPLAALAWSLWRSGAPGPAPSAGQRSEVRSDGLVMSLDHDTGAMDGEVLTGPLKGARLSDLGPGDLQALARQFEAGGDEDSLALLLAYLDRVGGGGPRTRRLRRRPMAACPRRRRCASSGWSPARPLTTCARPIGG